MLEDYATYMATHGISTARVWCHDDGGVLTRNVIDSSCVAGQKSLLSRFYAVFELAIASASHTSVTTSELSRLSGRELCVMRQVRGDGQRDAARQGGGRRVRPQRLFAWSHCRGRDRG